MKTSTAVLVLVLGFLVPSSVAAQAAPAPPTARPGAAAAAPPQPTVGPPIQRIESASAISKEPLGAITGVHELSDGRVLLNDGTRRRLLLMDTTLTVVSVVLDSLSEVANTYGIRPGALLPHQGDSILFVDPASFAIVVLDPQARFVRVRSVWRAEHVTYVSGSSLTYGWPGLDAQGRIVHRVPARAAPPLVPPPAGIPYFPTPPDSAFIVAADLATRIVDTIGVVRVESTEMRMRQTETGFSIEPVMNPFPMMDDWSVLSDGTIAFVRGREYRVDYLNPDGSWSSSERLPYGWERMTDEDKVRQVDSVKTVLQRAAANSYVTSMIRWVNYYGQQYPEGFTVPEGYVPTQGFSRDWMLPPGVQFPPNYLFACEGAAPLAMDAPIPPPAAAAASPADRPTCIPTLPTPPSATRPTLRTTAVVSPAELPDYKPPFANGSVRADKDGNLWIRTLQFRPGPGQGPVYDIVSRAGQLVNRIQLPFGYTLVGFGRDKVVYLSVRDAQGLHLARVRLR